MAVKVNRDAEELIDVSEFESDDALTVIDREEEEEETPLKEKAIRKMKVPEEIEEPKKGRLLSRLFKSAQIETGTFIASLRERFAAFLIDTLVLFYIYWIYATLYCAIFMGSWGAPVPYFGWHGFAFHGSFFVICFLYYFLLEGIFLATIGKFTCWMSVRRKDGNPATLPGALIRNIFRPVDYLMFPISLFVMELTSFHQRFGDILGRTTIVKKYIVTKEPYKVTEDGIASGTGRVLSIVIDVLLFTPFIAGYVLMWSSKQPIVSQWLVLGLPLVVLVYFVAIEMITETSPGKWLCGYIVCHDNGRRLTISSSIIRNFWKVFDFNPVAILTLFVSSYRQRPGDVAAGTIAIKHKRSIKGGVGFICALLIGAGAGYLGYMTPGNLLSPDFRLNFLPKISFINQFGLQVKELENITIDHFRFAANETNNYRVPPTFKAGEIVYLVFEIQGYTKKDRTVWIQEDLTVTYPDGTIGLKQSNIVDYKEVVKGSGPIELTNNLTLPANAAGGQYEVSITLRDMFAGSLVKDTRYFYVRRQVSRTGPGGEQGAERGGGDTSGGGSTSAAGETGRAATVDTATMGAATMGETPSPSNESNKATPSDAVPSGTRPSDIAPPAPVAPSLPSTPAPETRETLTPAKSPVAETREIPTPGPQQKTPVLEPRDNLSMPTPSGRDKTD